MFRKYKIKCSTYGGHIGWFLRKHFSKYTSLLYLRLQYLLRRSLYKKYMKYFEQKASQGNTPLPCLISIETINRCNSTCSFCPANRNQDKRPFRKMDESLFKKIIKELQEIDYQGYLNLYVNNEPFMDNRIEDWYHYAAEHLPNAKMLLYTNGTLLTKDRFIKIAPYIDKMIINNYSSNLKLHDNIKALYSFVKNEEKFWDKDISIQIRYIDEILTNRAGAAPNKQTKSTNKEPCIMPFTDFVIYPDGTVGLCCNDALEKTSLGNVTSSSLQDIWSSKIYQNLRKSISQDRNLYPFCQGCDFIDAGIRNTFIKKRLKERNPE